MKFFEKNKIIKLMKKSFKKRFLLFIWKRFSIELSKVVSSSILFQLLIIYREFIIFELIYYFMKTKKI